MHCYSFDYAPAMKAVSLGPEVCTDDPDGGLPVYKSLIPLETYDDFSPTCPPDVEDGAYCPGVCGGDVIADSEEDIETLCQQSGG